MLYMAFLGKWLGVGKFTKSPGFPYGLLLFETLQEKHVVIEDHSSILALHLLNAKELKYKGCKLRISCFLSVSTVIKMQFMVRQPDKGRNVKGKTVKEG